MSENLPDITSFKVFSYLNSDKASLYREIIKAFMSAKESFALHLRAEEVLAALRKLSGFETIQLIDAELNQLCAWGNLESHRDTSAVKTVEEFYKARMLYQVSAAGEIAERAIELYLKEIKEPGELQTVALKDIRSLLSELLEVDPTDEGKVYLTLSTLRSRFEDLTARAQVFMSSLQRSIDLQGNEISQFLQYKELLLEYLDRFVQQIVVSSLEISELVRKIERVGIDRLLAIAARRDLSDAFAPTQEDQQRALLKWKLRWDGLCSWFEQGGKEPSQSEILRARARAAIPNLLLAIQRINDRRSGRSDRAADFRVLALWFAQTSHSQDAHRLWTAAFGLGTVRHLSVNEDTLQEWEETPISSATSWLKAPPLIISPTLRKTGEYRAKRVRKVAIQDRSSEKARLAGRARSEAAQIVEAQRSLCNKGSTLLSEIGKLSREEFDLFLDLLGEALSSQARKKEFEVLSSDGTLSIRLQQLIPKKMARIETSTGLFVGLDYRVTISGSLSLQSSSLRKHLLCTDDQVKE